MHEQSALLDVLLAPATTVLLLSITEVHVPPQQLQLLI